MKKIISLLMGFIMMLSASGCGGAEPQSETQERKINIEMVQQPVSAQKIELPSNLQGYKNIYLRSFDGENAVFTIDTDDEFMARTARIVVFDVIKDNVTHMVGINMPNGKINSAVKKGDKLYFNIWFADSMTEKLYVNNGLENILISESEISTMVDYSRLQLMGDKLLYLKNHGSFDNFDYEFFEVNNEELVSVYTHKQEYESFIEIEDYSNGEFTLNEIDLSDKDKLTFNTIKGNDKQTVFSLSGENGHSFAKLDNVIIHPVNSLENDNAYKMIAVTDFKNKSVTEIGMMQGGFFGDVKDKGLMYTYGESPEQILLFEADDDTLKITPIDIDVTGKNSHSYFMTENNALLKISTLNVVDTDWIESGMELYIIEY